MLFSLSIKLLVLQQVGLLSQSSHRVFVGLAGHYR
jgi:hypothetical protein